VAEIIVALDLPSARDALELVDRLRGLRWVKVGPVLYVREGPALVRELTARGLRVFLDLKWHDIPSTVTGAVAAARELGVAMATVHGLGGKAMLEAASHAAGDGAGNLAIVAVTVLTSHDSGDFEQVLGRGVPDLGFEAERLARTALQAGLRGVVASGHELTLLREALGPEPWIVVPGIRPPSERADDQMRTVTPQDAVRGGATHLVIGRPITQAQDPAAAFTRLVEEVLGAGGRGGGTSR
jgi:orotidine-5'-phosphate decarboxylase